MYKIHLNYFRFKYYMPTPAIGTTITYTNVTNEFTLSINPPSRAIGVDFRFAGGTYTPASPAIPTGATSTIRLSGDLGGRTKVSAGPLYPWTVSTTYTFTAGSTFGANASATLPVYAAPFYPSYIAMPQAGYQYLTIGNTGTYTITCAGAGACPSQPGKGGAGAIIRGSTSLSVNDILIICCGQTGTCNGGISGGGGGGQTAVFRSRSGTIIPLIVATGGGGAAGPGTGAPPVTFPGVNAPSAIQNPPTASANGTPLVRGSGSGTQTSVSASAAQPLWSVGLINSSGTRLGGKGSSALSGTTDGGWGGAGNGGGGAGDGGSAGGWIGGNGVGGKIPGNAGTNYVDNSVVSSQTYVGANPSAAINVRNTTTGNGYVQVTRDS